MSEQPKCEVCGEPMPDGEEMFKYHGYSGPCPKPSANENPIKSTHAELLNRLHEMQCAPYYATARSDLCLAENVIFQLEQENRRVLAELERLHRLERVAACGTVDSIMSQPDLIRSYIAMGIEESSRRKRAEEERDQLRAECERLRWHEWPDEVPDAEGEYLVEHAAINGTTYLMVDEWRMRSECPVSWSSASVEIGTFWGNDEPLRWTRLPAPRGLIHSAMQEQPK